MGRVKVEVVELEYEEGGDTLWVHSPLGATVLRLKLLHGTFKSLSACENVCTHVDVMVDRLVGKSQDVSVCVVEDSTVTRS